jgi:hypothetical protein
MKEKVLYNIDLLQYIYNFLDCQNYFQEICNEWNKIPKKCIYFKSEHFKFPKYCISCYPKYKDIFEDISKQYLKHLSKKNNKKVFYVHSRIDLDISDYEKIIYQTHNLEIFRKCCRETHGIYKYVAPGVGLLIIE